MSDVHEQALAQHRFVRAGKVPAVKLLVAVNHSTEVGIIYAYYASNLLHLH